MAKRIMIVDDAGIMRMLLKQILSKGGYEVAAEVGDGASAVKQYPAVKPDLVTMYITMPDMDGMTAVQ